MNKLKHTLQHMLSHFIGKWANCRCAWVKNNFIRAYKAYYGINLHDCQQQSPADFACFNDFFARKLLTSARPLPDDPSSLISPADGCINQFGQMIDTTLVQAKGQHYQLSDLLTDPTWIQQLTGGNYINIYLSPRDYHRVHMPISGQLVSMTKVAGHLFPVNQKATANVPGLLCRNERLICRFHTESGPMVVVMIGALIVGSIVTRWAGVVKNNPGERFTHWDYPEPIQINRGDEIGHFHLGSSVICITQPGAFTWDNSLQAGQALQFGHKLASSSHTNQT